MAGDEENVDLDEEHAADNTTVPKAAKHDSRRAADLEKVTDYVEEAEISSQNICDVSMLWLVFIIAQSPCYCHASTTCIIKERTSQPSYIRV